MLIAIWAQAENGLIGKENKLPWYLPNDLKFFRSETEHNTLVMGRKTFEGMGSRPLPNRKTIVLTRQEDYQAKGVEIMHAPAEILAYANHYSGTTFIAGGAGVYKELLPYCDQLYRTVIEETFSGDAYMPEIDWSKWQLLETKQGIVDDKNLYPHRFEVFQKITDQ